MRTARDYLVFGVLALIPVSTVSLRADWETAKRAYDRGDYAAALKEVKPLAGKGDANAQALLGLMYNQGRGVPLNVGQAMKWYKASAEQGNAAAQCRLGSIYLKTDTTEGLKLLKLSAAQGFTDAYLMLGLAYMNLKEAPRDPVQADMWLRLAAARGDPLASGQLGKLESHMSRDQIAKAQSLVTAWHPQAAPVPPEKAKTE